jgi:phosphoglycolate phosphatase-like HAD superfamily hydrolase
MADPNPSHTDALSRRSMLIAASAIVATAATLSPTEATAQTPTQMLASWNDGPAKQAIVNFVRTITDPSSKDFVPPEDRIATFDQDGTLWTEHPLYAQAIFALYRVHEMAPQHQEWQSHEPFKAVLSNDPAALGKLTERDWFVIIAATHSGMTTDAFPALVARWIEAARDPRFKRPFTDLVYQPMREVMDYLRANGFTTYIVTGGGQDFVRVYAQRVYGVPPQQVAGSTIETAYAIKDGKPLLMRLPKAAFIDDGDGKAIGIQRVIGKRPSAAFGNSDGDREMLEWTGAGAGARLSMLVHHDDARREYAYGPAGGQPDTKVGTFSASLMTEATTRGWTVISMKNDWRRVFAFDAV